MFDPYTRDLRALRAELDAFGALLQSGLATLPNWRILTSPLATLNAVWRNYRVSVDVDEANQVVTHTDVIYVIGPGGDLRYSVTPFANESRAAVYSLTPSLIDRFGHGLATYANLAAR